MHEQLWGAIDDLELPLDKRSVLSMPAYQDKLADQALLRDRVLAMVAQLPPKYQLFYRLRYERDLTMVEIGERMHISPESAAWLHLRLKRYLAPELKPLADAA